MNEKEPRYYCTTKFENNIGSFYLIITTTTTLFFLVIIKEEEVLPTTEVTKATTI